MDDLKDPGNVGTLIRVADWFGLAGVVLSPGSADPFGPKALQSSMGSTFHVPVLVESLQGLPTAYKTHVVGLDAGGTDLFSGSIARPTLLVVGSESHGLSETVVEACHVIASIPGAGRAESLNASVAGAVAVASFIQQAVS
ncbi:MAG: TrmH family RNA methyltransferase [Flavobacteriales bacterium]